jgi:hypothetical protein
VLVEAPAPPPPHMFTVISVTPAGTVKVPLLVIVVVVCAFAMLTSDSAWIKAIYIEKRKTRKEFI